MVTIKHKEIIDEELNAGNNVVIQIIQGIKSSQNKIANPFSFEERQAMFGIIYQKEIVSGRIKILKFLDQYLPTIVYELEVNHNIIISQIKSGQDRCQGYRQQFENINKTSEIYDFIVRKYKSLEFICKERKGTDNTISQSRQRKLLIAEDFASQRQIIPFELNSFLRDYQLNLRERSLIESIMYQMFGVDNSHG